MSQSGCTFQQLRIDSDGQVFHPTKKFGRPYDSIIINYLVQTEIGTSVAVNKMSCLGAGGSVLKFPVASSKTLKTVG